MIIQRNTAYSVPTTSSPGAFFRHNRQPDSGNAATTSDKVSVSQAARDLLSTDSTDKYRLQGKAISLQELIEKNPGMVKPISDARREEHKLWEAQTKAREEAINRYAQEHPSRFYGQVVVNGNLFATVWDSGTAQTPGPFPGLTNDGSSPLEIAKARLREIAQAVGGKIIYSNFLPLPGGGSEFCGAVIPESFLASLPPITARPFFQD